MYITYPDKSKVFNALQAFIIAFTSAWAVGLFSIVTLIAEAEIISPSLTITASKGLAPFLTLAIDS